MQSSHAATAVDVAFDDPNLIADAGLVPVVALAEQVGLPQLIAEHVSIVDAANSAGANPVAKVMSLVAGMVAGADSIADVDRLRHAGDHLVFERVRAPSTLGTFLVRHEALLFRMGVRDHPSPRRRSGEVKLEAA
jgi:hypothetical protein